MAVIYLPGLGKTEFKGEEGRRTGDSRRVYYNAKTDYPRGEWTAGALFHKSAPIIGEDK